MARNRKEWGRTFRQTHEELDRSIPRRRHTSAIAPTSRSVDMAKPSLKLIKARQQLRTNVTERQAAQKSSNAMESQRRRREVPISCDSYDFIRTSSKMVIRDATPTERQQTKHTKTDKRDVLESQSFDFTRNKSIVNESDRQTESRLLTPDLQLGKHKVSRPSRTKRGRRSTAAGSVHSSLAPVHTAMDTKLSSVQRNFKRYDASFKETKKQICHPVSTKGVSIAGSNSFCQSKKSSDQRIDCHLSAMDLRPQSRRHTTTEALARDTKTSRHGNLAPVVEELDSYEHDRYARFQQKKMTEPIDFHLSRFNLTSRRSMAEAESMSNNVKVGRHDSHRKEKMEKAIPASSDQAKFALNKLCDLAYLEKYRSHTL
ncbi:unnamed protein product [Peronospora farinosa]|uniref:Uncharacterized protein n=1 Tax=Peronospora farinosa TaxID=134698 RepID=A0AAV0UUB2_9STRA|nr:unnamed protein product [Peronospora farinosa]CAH0491989.1 unnamed protein product [Peronospora farinosa]CAI5738891.1 unnamed protein product [Peronospora farinosa]